MANHASTLMLLLLTFSLPHLHKSESHQASAFDAVQMRGFALSLGVWRDLKIELLLAVPNKLIKTLATDESAAEYWVRKNVVDLADAVQLRYVVVGYEIPPEDPNGAPFVVGAMENVYSQLRSAGLGDRIKVSTTVNGADFLSAAEPPSAGEFREAAADFVGRVAGFLIRTGAPIVVNAYRHLKRVDFNGRRVSHESFNETRSVSAGGDNGEEFDFLDYDVSKVAAFVSALEKNGGGDLEILVSVCDWPSDHGGGGGGESIESSGVPMFYFRNFIDFDKTGKRLNLI